MVKFRGGGIVLGRFGWVTNLGPGSKHFLWAEHLMSGFAGLLGLPQNDIYGFPRAENIPRNIVHNHWSSWAGPGFRLFNCREKWNPASDEMQIAVFSSVLIAAVALLALVGHFSYESSQQTDVELLVAKKPDYSPHQWLKVKRSILLAEVNLSFFLFFQFSV